MAGPALSLSASVATLSNEAKGISAKKLVRKIVVGDHSSAPEIIAKGRNTRRTLMYALQK